LPSAPVAPVDPPVVSRRKIATCSPAWARPWHGAALVRVGRVDVDRGAAHRERQSIITSIVIIAMIITSPTRRPRATA